MAQTSGTFNRLSAITVSDTVNFDGSTYAANAATKALPADGILVGGAGVVVVITENGLATSVTCVAGQQLNVKSIRVNNTSTTATALVAGYQI